MNNVGELGGADDLKKIVVDGDLTGNVSRGARCFGNRQRRRRVDRVIHNSYNGEAMSEIKRIPLSGRIVADLSTVTAVAENTADCVAVKISQICRMIVNRAQRSEFGRQQCGCSRGRGGA